MHTDPIVVLSRAMSAALLRDLDSIKRTARQANASVHAGLNGTVLTEGLWGGNESQTPAVARLRRPSAEDVQIQMFPQTWPATCLGYGGRHEMTLTTAHTVVVATKTQACVYFGGGELAYRVDLTQLTGRKLELWERALTLRCLPSRGEARRIFKTAVAAHPTAHQSRKIQGTLEAALWPQGEADDFEDDFEASNDICADEGLEAA